MCNEVGIVFVHHSTGPSTSNNLALVCALNPDAVVVTLSQEGDTFRGGYNSRELTDRKWGAYRRKWNEYGWKQALFGDRGAQQRGFIWRNADLALYQWYTRRKEQAKRWVILEWDVLCTVGVREFYAEVWDADLAAVNVKRRESSPDWVFFSASELGKLPARFRPFATGVTPLAGLLISDRALSSVVEVIAGEAGFRDSFCELRLGTAAVASGFVPVELPASAKATLQDDHTFAVESIEGKGIWHKVKDHHVQRFGELLGK